MTWLLPIWTLWWRELIRFVRQRGRVLGALGTPLIFWWLIGSGLGTSFRLASAPPDFNYLNYFYPGTLLLVVLFTSIFSGISVIEDRKQGILLALLVAPVHRSSITLGKISGAATLAFLQGVLLLFLCPFLGIALEPIRFLFLASTVGVVSLALAALGIAAAWHTSSVQSYHAVMNLMLFPIWLLSGAVFPPSGAFSWVQWVMQFNPLTYALSLLHRGIYGEAARALGFPDVPLSVAVTLLFAGVCCAGSFFLLAGSRARHWE